MVFFRFPIGTTCPSPPDLVNGYFNFLTEEDPSFLQDTVVEFKCDPGYSLVNGSKLICKDTQWISGDSPRCER